VSHPLVSILIPAFNAAPWIRDTIESARAQTWPSKEIIVIDDGSTDETADIVERLAAPDVHLFRQSHSGSSAAHNHAFRLCTGAFIQCLDADDLIASDKIERQMARLTDSPRSVAGGEWARFVSDPSAAQFPTTADATDLPPEEWLRNECAGGSPMLQPGIWLAARETVEVAGPWDERLSLNNDFDYGVRLLLAADSVLSCPGARLYYRSGNPLSLASRRSDAAWQSALHSLELGTAAILQRDTSAAARQACADLFQQLAYAAYLESPPVFAAASRAAGQFGGSSVRMDGGRLFRMLRATLGWQRAKEIKSLAYRAGYARVARAKEAALGGGLRA
jgi:hypothetical protein